MKARAGRLIRKLQKTYSPCSSAKPRTLYFATPAIFMLSYYLFAIAMVFLQGLFPWPLLVLLVVLWRAVRREATEVYILAFFSGLLADLLLGRNLGTTAAFMLLVCSSVFLYKTRAKINVFVFLVFVIIWELIAKFLWA